MKFVCVCYNTFPPAAQKWQSISCSLLYYLLFRVLTKYWVCVRAVYAFDFWSICIKLGFVATQRKCGVWREKCVAVKAMLGILHQLGNGALCVWCTLSHILLYQCFILHQQLLGSKDARYAALNKLTRKTHQILFATKNEFANYKGIMIIDCR